MPWRTATGAVFPSPFLLSAANRNGDNLNTKGICHINGDNHRLSIWVSFFISIGVSSFIPLRRLRPTRWTEKNHYEIVSWNEVEYWQILWIRSGTFCSAEQLSDSPTMCRVPYTASLQCLLIFGQWHGFYIPLKILETSAVSFVAQRQRYFG